MNNDESSNLKNFNYNENINSSESSNRIIFSKMAIQFIRSKGGCESFSSSFSF